MILNQTDVAIKPTGTSDSSHWYCFENGVWSPLYTPEKNYTLREARKDICVQIANGLLQEMQQLLSGEISMFISTEQIEGKMISTLQQDAECFNEALHFQKKVNNLVVYLSIHGDFQLLYIQYLMQ